MLFCVAILIAIGCANQHTPSGNNEERVAPVAKYRNSIHQNKDILMEWSVKHKYAQDQRTRATQEEAEKHFELLSHTFLPMANVFASELGLTKRDLEELIGAEIYSQREYEEALLGVYLFSTMATSSLQQQSTRSDVYEDLKDCLGEATGIYASYEIIKTLSSGAMSKSAIKAVIKAVAKLGGKTLVRCSSGIGLALLAADVAYCMWSD